MRVLIVDDEPLVRRSLVRVLKAKGHDVFEAADGLSGETLWRSQEPDLVFLDVLMPGLTGPQLLERIGERTARVVMMSAYAGEHSVETADQSGADLFVNKPFEDIFSIVQLAESLLEQANA